MNRKNNAVFPESFRENETVLFDLDGTLTDPGLGITNSVMFALKRFGIEVDDRRKLYGFIGPPLIPSFEKFYGFSHKDAERAVGFYREYFRDKGIFENEVYPGIPEMLSALQKAGKRLRIATSKPEVFALRIAEHFSLSLYFDRICGSELDGRRVDKAEVIAYALDGVSAKEKEKTVMVGDREHDIFGAKKNALRSVGVLYGYGNLEELRSAGADMIAESVPVLKKQLLDSENFRFSSAVSKCFDA